MAAKKATTGGSRKIASNHLRQFQLIEAKQAITKQERLGEYSYQGWWSYFLVLFL
jgi:hypothetical protein